MWHPRRKPHVECVTKEEHQTLLGEVRSLKAVVRSLDLDRDDYGWSDWDRKSVLSEGEKTGLTMALTALADVRRGIFSLDEVMGRLDAYC